MKLFVIWSEILKTKNPTTRLNNNESQKTGFHKIQALEQRTIEQISVIKSIQLKQNEIEMMVRHFQKTHEKSNLSELKIVSS